MAFSKRTKALQFAVIDIETTGGYAAQNGIIEIAAIITDGYSVLDEFYAMINPQMSIPPFIEGLTGISNEVVAGLPPFSSVAKDLFNLIHDKVFVAHNVNFDYSFVKYHLEQQGYHLQSKKLCTIRLSRKVVPGLRGYGLDKICKHLNIEIEGRHSAFGDASATAELLRQLISKGGTKYIDEMLSSKSGEMSLPPNVNAQSVMDLPQKPGVYFFHEKSGKVIYVGKAKNIRKRVRSHFSNNKSGKQKQEFLKRIYRITYHETATELMAFVLEGVEIKNRWPEENTSQKHADRMYGLYSYIDSCGYKRLLIDRKYNYVQSLTTFSNLSEGLQLLRKLIREYQLCPYLCFLTRNNEDCHLDEYHCNGACRHLEPCELYNRKVDKCISELEDHLPTFAVMDKGMKPGERSCILIEKGRFVGMGYVPTKTEWNWNELKSTVTPYADSQYVCALIVKYAGSHPYQTFSF